LTATGGRIVCAPAGAVLELTGAAYDRGRLQAALRPDRVADVSVAVTRRLAELGPALALPNVIAWLDAQHAFLRDHDPEGYVEVQGIAEGFGIAADALFACLYGNVIADLSGDPALADACTAWATAAADAGPIVVKNRDSRGAQGELEGIFRHSDPDWGARRILCVGTLGAPGAFAGGINTDGLAIVDTHVGTPDHGEGWLRPFLMSRVLRECATVAEAVALVFRLPHAGGGTLLMGDAKGAVAAIELTHGAVAAEEPGERDYIARTNHFMSDRLRGRDLAGSDDMGGRASRARIATLEHALRGLPLPFAVEAIKKLMARHGDRASAGLCRHDEPRGVLTLSCAIFDCRSPALVFSLGPPCEGRWTRIAP
jgi:isopenicillin-N N-acyltransferase like protein